ncbi:hypothetical protein HGA34_01255 [Candidatus Falkowbacteria bacterium]|nr:hypothetical protein [Candidatus Falkowbacteria bacterium]
MASRYIKIYLIRMRASVMTRMAYPLNFFILTISVIAQGLLSIIFIKVIYKYASNISGWNYDQAMLVLASFLIVEGMMWTTNAYMAGIRKNVLMGSFDRFLIQPLNTLFSVSTWRVDPEDLMRLVIAGYIFASTIGHLHLPAAELLTRGWVYALLILDGYIVFYSLSLAINSLYFWYSEISSINIMFENFLRMAQYPTDILYGKFIKIFFSTIFPIAFMATVPARALAFGADYLMLLAATAIALAFFFSARAIFNAGLRAYSSASS